MVHRLGKCRLKLSASEKHHVLVANVLSIVIRPGVALRAADHPMCVGRLAQHKELSRALHITRLHSIRWIAFLSTSRPARCSISANARWEGCPSIFFRNFLILAPQMLFNPSAALFLYTLQRSRYYLTFLLYGKAIIQMTFTECQTRPRNKKFDLFAHRRLQLKSQYGRCPI